MRIERWLYRGGRPNRLASFLNRGWAALYGLGILPRFLVALEVIGRRSGRVISMPLVVAEHAGERYLVSMLGERASWVRNVHAAGGRAVLRRGHRERVGLEEVPVERRAAIVKAYLGRAPGARPHVPVHKDAPLAEFEAIAARVPVFRVVALGPDDGS